MLYSVDQVAEMLGLHVKTVRGYVRDGRLRATRVGRQYRISADDLTAFTGQPVTPRHVDVSVFVQMENVDFPAMSRITTMVSAYATASYGGERLHVETVYDQDRAVLKVVAVGGLSRTAGLLEALRTVSE